MRSWDLASHMVCRVQCFSPLVAGYSFGVDHICWCVEDIIEMPSLTNLLLSLVIFCLLNSFDVVSAYCEH